MRPSYALREDPRPVRGHGDRVLRVRGAAAVGGARPPHHPHPGPGTGGEIGSTLPSDCAAVAAGLEW
jgi:hypothetical protein